MKENQTDVLCEKIYLAELKPCPNRTDRVYDGKVVMCCGYRVIMGDECITCKVHSDINC